MPSIRVPVLVSACILLSAGCGGGSANHEPAAHGSVPPPATAVSPASPGASGDLAAPGASASSASPDRASAPWVLSTPVGIDGYPRYRPTASQQRAITQQVTADAAELGITGTQVSAVYEDRADLLYSVFAGVQGSGFDPTSLHSKLWQPPRTQDNGTARVTLSWEDTDPGPHGGAAICKQTLTQTGMLAVEATSCYWMSPSTFGEVFLIQDPHAQKIVYDQSAATMGPLMRKLRAAVERHS